MKVKAFVTHKLSEKFTDCQDRFGINPDTKSVAVSDGMSSSWQQKKWARILADEYVNSKDWIPTTDTIKPLCKKWRDEVVADIERMKNSNTPENLIYRNERNLASGRSAGATLVGIRFSGTEWKGSVLGDSCLIEWDGKEKIATFHTSQDVESFDAYPDYFDSNAANEGKGTPKEIQGVLTKDRMLFLVSDPFSDFLFEQNKQGDIAHYIDAFVNVSSHGEFEKLVADWRSLGMHNDDTTLVSIIPDETDNIIVQNMDNIDALIDEEKRAEILTPVPASVVLSTSSASFLESTEEEDIQCCECSLEEIEETFRKYMYANLSRRHTRKLKRICGKVLYKLTKEDCIDAFHKTLKDYKIIKKQK